jgi:Flp pilus assembly pilin Flp
MRRFNGLIGGFVRDARGTTAIEYGLIAALVAIGRLAGARRRQQQQLGQHLRQDHGRHEGQIASAAAAIRRCRVAG